MKPILLAIALACGLALPAPVLARGLGPDSSVSADPCAKAKYPQSCRRALNAQKKRPADCHRDVRTHRIGGVRIRHRHVGDNCAVREVRSGTSF